MNQFSQLRKALVLANDQGLTVGLSVPMPATLVNASTSVSDAHISIVVIILKIVETNIPILTLKMGQKAAVVADLSVRGSSPSHSHAKTGRGDSPYTPIEGGDPKRARLAEGDEQDALNYFFRFLAILPYTW